MDFAFTSDQQLLKNSARAFLDEHCKPATVRMLWDDARGESEAMWKEMAQLGWLGLALPEVHGGSDLGLVECSLLLEELGRASYPGPFLPTVLVGMGITRAGTDAQKQRWLPAICAGGARAATAFLDGELSWAPDAIATRAEKSGSGWTLSGTKPFVAWAHVADVMLVPAHAPEGLALFLVDPQAGGITQTPVTAMDLATRWVNLTLDGVAVGADADLAASVAKAYVGDASRKVCGEAIQVHGGIGFTWEYDLHLYFKRAKALEVQYGDADYHRELITAKVTA